MVSSSFNVPAALVRSPMLVVKQASLRRTRIDLRQIRTTTTTTRAQSAGPLARYADGGWAAREAKLIDRPPQLASRNQRWG
jgi:hypothetical protein